MPERGGRSRFKATTSCAPCGSATHPNTAQSTAATSMSSGTHNRGSSGGQRTGPPQTAHTSLPAPRWVARRRWAKTRWLPTSHTPLPQARPLRTPSGWGSHIVGATFAWSDVPHMRSGPAVSTLRKNLTVSKRREAAGAEKRARGWRVRPRTTPNPSNTQT